MLIIYVFLQLETLSLDLRGRIVADISRSPRAIFFEVAFALESSSPLG